MTEDLIIIENLDPAKLFTGDGLDELLKMVSTQVNKFVPDVSTALGRKDLASLAHKIARSRTALDKLGKDHVAAAKKELKKFDANRKMAKEFLEDLQAKTRKPLTEWEAAEEKRVQDIADRVQAIKDMVPTEAYMIDHLGIAVLSGRSKELQELDIGEDFEEMIEIAVIARDESLIALTAIVGRLETQAKEKAELDQLRKDAEAQRQKDRDAEIAKQATANAEANAAVEKQEAIDAKVAAEKRADEAEVAAQVEIGAALARVEAGKVAEQEDIRKREANTQHKGKIHREIVEAICKVDPKFTGVAEVLGKKIVKAMVKREIPHVTINY